MRDDFVFNIINMDFKPVVPNTLKARRKARSRVKGKIKYVKGEYVLDTPSIVYTIREQEIVKDLTKDSQEVLHLYPHFNNDAYNKPNQIIDSTKHPLRWLKINKRSKKKLAILNQFWSIYYHGQKVINYELHEDGTVTILKTN